MNLPMILRRRLLAAGLAAPLGAACAAEGDDYAAARQRMLAEVEMDMRDTARSTGRERLDPRVAAAIGKVPRHRFVPPQLASRAYENRPLPIGHEQTISQPFIVALMTELVARVYTIEIVRPLGERAAELLKALGYRNVETRIGDGYLGWPEAAPFDAIVVTAAPEKMPQPLVDQLAPNGRLIAPVGSRFGIQTLQLLRKDAQGRAVARSVLEVRFVPLTRSR
jgi:protein-L-isoaspartate(D-aspartate) O-methyltransferase